MRMIKTVCSCLLFTITNISFAQKENRFDFERIEDNSFLLEEAYNQEPGVIQHISAFQLMNDKTWAYSFTEEWPVPNQTHQLSTTILFLNSGYTGWGDVALNYRYQAIMTDRFAFSPRFSLILPTGDYKKELGNGAWGYQTNLPVSFICSRKFVTHYNLGVTYTPGAKDVSSGKSNISNVNYGASAIFLLTETFNFMVEVYGNTILLKPDNSKTEVSNALFINPIIRYAINCKSGLQIVPGIAVPIGVGPSKGEFGLFAYLSFEHPMWKP